MCKSCWECIKCPAKVLCCCCECACNLIICIVCSVFGLIIVIGLIVYFTVIYNKNIGPGENIGTGEEGQKIAEQLVQQTPESFRDFFKSIQ